MKKKVVLEIEVEEDGSCSVDCPLMFKDYNVDDTCPFDFDRVACAKAEIKDSNNES